MENQENHILAQFLDIQGHRRNPGHQSDYDFLDFTSKMANNQK